MNRAIKDQAVEILAGKECWKWNYLNHKQSFIDEYSICHCINFDLDYWDDVLISDVKEIAEAVDERLAALDLRSELLPV